MNLRAKILLVSVVLIFMVTVYAGKSCDFTCLDSPSGTCVLDESGNILQYCAVGCYETPEPNDDAICDYGAFTCAFYARLDDFSCWNGLPASERTPTVRCAVAEWVGHEELSDCKLICAAECGRKTQLAGDCGNCSREVCSRYFAGTTVHEACGSTCESICEANRQFCDIVVLLRYGALFVGVIMLILHGFKWMVSDDIEGRKDARRGIVYVLVGLSFIVLASALVELMFFKTIICSPSIWWFI